MVAVDVLEFSSEFSTHILSLQFHKLITDPASGLENTAATWTTSSSSCCDSHNPESISGSVTHALDRFLEKYRRVNEEDCRPAAFAATGRLSCAGQWGGAECWMKVSNAPGCYQSVVKVPRAPRPFLRPPDKREEVTCKHGQVTVRNSAWSGSLQG